MTWLLSVLAAWLLLPSAWAADDPVTGLQKKWADPCADRIERFTQDLGQLVVGLDRMPGYATEIGWEAVQQMTDLNRDQQKVVCDALDTPAARSLDVESLSNDFAPRRAGSGCIGVNTYYGILGLRTVLDGIQQGLQAFCDSSSCPSVFPPEPPSCGIACAVVPPFGIASEIISTRMDISDNCRFADHSEEMDLLRGESTETIGSLFEGINEAIARAASAYRQAMQAAAFAAAFDDIAPAFDGDGSREPEDGTNARAPVESTGIGPALEGLQSVVAAGRIEQQQFERRALRARLENALLTGATYSRMLRPRAFDGVLEEIRELVAQRIQAVDAAGGDTTLALQQFRNGDTAFNKSDYRAALSGYRSAYEALGSTRRPPEPVPIDTKGGA